MLTARENFIRNARFQVPEWIPMHVHINDAAWDVYREEYERICMKYPTLFPHVQKGWRDYDHYEFAPAYRANEPFTDSWGSVWVSPRNGIEGVVRNAVLEDWDDFANYKLPDPVVMWDRSVADWAGFARSVANAKENGQISTASLPHGFFLLRLTYLRGFENAMIDFAVDEPNMTLLMDELEKVNARLVRGFLDAGVDMINFPEDLGTQTSTFLSPAMFHKYISPRYERLMAPVKRAGVLVGMHSDGKTLDILEEQVRAGVDIVNPQDLCNGIDEIARVIKGKACIDLDIDRQTILPYGSPQDVHDLIREEVMKLGSPQGGLSFIAGIYPPTPPENLDALCSSLLKYQRYWWQ